MSRHRQKNGRRGGHGGGSPSQRQLRVGELLRRRLSEVLSRGDVHDPRLQSLSITVAEVRASPDLRVATVYALPLGGRHRDEALAALRENGAELRRAVAKGLDLKYAPELRFVLGDSFDRMDETRRLLESEPVRRDVEGG